MLNELLASRTNEAERRSVRFEVSEVRQDNPDKPSGVLRGKANVLGAIDSYRSIFVPGCFRDCLAEHLRSGHVCWNHDVSKWIGTPTRAVEDGRSLIVEGEFYTDEESQAYRQKLVERTERGKTTDFSMTFFIDWSQVREFRNGQHAWDAMTGDMGVPAERLDPTIRDDKDWVWTIQRVKELTEWGPVISGAVPGAEMAGIRSNDLEETPHAGVTLELELRHALAAVEGARTRVEALAKVRASDNRRVSPERIAQLAAIRAALDELITAVASSPDARAQRLIVEAEAFLAGF